MTYDYHFGGLRIRSDIALPGLLKADAAQGREPQLRLTAEAGAPLSPDRVWYEWQQGYRLQLSEHGGRWLFRSRFDGSFLIDRDGSAMHLVARTLPPSPEVIEVLLRRVLVRAPILQGAIAIHAASLACSGGSAMLIGQSGAGKSTLCAALAGHPGWQVLGDDTALLWNREVPMLGAGAGSVCLWPESHDSLRLPPGRSELLASATGKRRAMIEGHDPQPLVPLRAILLLDRTADAVEPRLERLSVADAMNRVIRQSVRFNPHGDSGQERIDSVQGIMLALRSSPAWRLVYPSSFAALPRVEALLRPLLGGAAKDCAVSPA